MNNVLEACVACGVQYHALEEEEKTFVNKGLFTHFLFRLSQSRRLGATNESLT